MLVLAEAFAFVEAVTSHAVLAAIALEHGCAVASLDRDFARFSSIHHVIPG